MKRSVLFLAAAVIAIVVTGCGKTENEDSSAFDITDKTNSMAETVDDALSEVSAESGKEELESSEESSGSSADKEESEPEEEMETEAVTDPPAEPEPEVIESEFVHNQGTGYSFDIDLSRWVDAMGSVTITETDTDYDSETQGVEYVYGWKGDSRSSCVFAHYASDEDYSQFDISELGEIVAQQTNSIEGETVISWDIQNFSGADWIRCECELDPNVFGVQARGLQYECLRGYDMFIISFTIAEESVERIDGDLRTLLDSVVLE